MKDILRTALVLSTLIVIGCHGADDGCEGDGSYCDGTIIYRCVDGDPVELIDCSQFMMIDEKQNMTCCQFDTGAACERECGYAR